VIAIDYHDEILMIEDCTFYKTKHNGCFNFVEAQNKQLKEMASKSDFLLRKN